MPTTEQIAAEVRRRPIGAVIADIFRDLGVVPGHFDRAFWDELSLAIIRHGGSLVRLAKDTLDRLCPLPPRAAPSVAPAASRPSALRGTGPPAPAA
jgi:hypothetical protein